MNPARRAVRIPPLELEGSLDLPSSAKGLVIFAHGSGSSRFSPRNRFVADALGEAGLATLLFDLLSGTEATDRANVFDIALLAKRLLAAKRLARDAAAIDSLPVGYFGASTGAAAALLAAAEDKTVAAVVSRGGRPDLAGPALAQVEAATLLIVGGMDEEVLGLNRAAQRRLHCENRLEIVPGATHLFEEPGALESVVDLAQHWFLDHFSPVGQE